MKNLFCLIGIPGCGKSTWVQKNNITPESSAVINMDSIRESVTGSASDQSQNALVATVAKQNLMTALSIGVPTIFWDNTTTQRKYRKEIILSAKKGGYTVHAVYFDLPFEVCVSRNNSRTRIVPEEILRRMKSQIQLPTSDEGWDDIIMVTE